MDHNQKSETSTNGRFKWLNLDKWLPPLTLKWKLLGIGAVPLAGLLAIEMDSIREQVGISDETQDQEANIVAILSGSKAVAETQVERGMTVSHLAGAASTSQLMYKKMQTNQAIAKFLHDLDASGFSEEAQASIAEQFKKLRTYREQALANRSIPFVLKNYTEVIYRVLDLYVIAARENRLPGISGRLSSVRILEESKENAGKLRANLTGAAKVDAPLAEGKISMFHRLDGGMRGNLNARGLDLSDSGVSFRQKILESGSWKTLSGMLGRTLERSVQGGYELDPAQVFTVATSVVDSIFDLVSNESKSVTALAQQYRMEADQEVWNSIYRTLGIFLAAMIFLALVNRKITGPVRDTVQVMENLAAGDLTKKVKSTTRDEISQLAGAVNQTVDYIRTAFNARFINWEAIPEMKRREKEAVQRATDESASALKARAAAEDAASQAEQEKEKSVKAMREAQESQKAAADALESAEASKRDAEVSAKEAETEKERANAALEEATKSQQEAESEKEAANRLRVEATELRERAEKQTEQLKENVEIILQTVAAAAKGDLTQEVTITTDDAVADVADGLNELFASLRESLNSIAVQGQQLGELNVSLHEANESVLGNSSETSQLSERMVATSDSLNSNMTAAAASAEELAASIQEVARTTSEAAEMARDISSQSDSTKDEISHLNSSIDNIGGIVKIINSIASQTNLLALNATIEAARAGEAGKGFAVVANEVKELALQTSNATSQIEAHIAAVTEGANRSVAAIHRISGRVSEMDEISASIAASVEEQSAVTREISGMIQNSNESTKSVSGDVSRVSEAAMSTTDKANVTTRIAENVKDVSNQLVSLVDRFKTRDSEGVPAMKIEAVA